ncbi:Uncharacterised protein [Mycobacteroides abscessus subsp. abscessus]|nr:Uncharacterised protein [Mycobacteroides abscessus subsp. abscessus]
MASSTTIVSKMSVPAITPRKLRQGSGGAAPATFWSARGSMPSSGSLIADPFRTGSVRHPR